VITPGGPATADGEPDDRWVAAHARAAHVFGLGSASYLKPWLDLGVQHVRQDGYAETGAGSYGLRVDAVEDTIVTLAPTLELGTAFDLGGIAAEASFSGGALALLGGADRSTTVRLAGVGADGPGFTVADGLEDLYATLGARVKARVGDRLTLEAGLDALLGGDRQSYVGSARLVWSF
jgi:uncharacterized protein with beta-barrel porin domain